MSRKGKRLKANLSDIAEDAKVVAIEKEDTPKKDIPKNIPKDILTEPEDIGGAFEFEKPPSDSSNPLNIPLADETIAEGKTMQNLGFEMDDDFKEPPPPPPQASSTFDQASSKTFDQASNIIDDDVPPPNPNEPDLFDQVGDEEGSIGGRALPEDFVTWSAEQQADWIVNTELVVAHGFIHNRTKISTISVKQKVLKYKVPRNIAADVNDVVKSYNDEVEKNLVITSDAKKALKSSWVAVLKQYTNISDKITPEAALLLNHGLFFGQLWMVSNQFKKQGIQVVQDITDIFKEYNSNQSNQSSQANSNTNSQANNQNTQNKD